MNLAERSLSVSRQLQGLFECAPLAAGLVRVVTPFLYPDNDHIEVFIVERDGHWMATDQGETFGWLFKTSACDELSPQERRTVEETCAGLGVEFDGLCLEAAAAQWADAGRRTLAVAQAAALIADRIQARRRQESELAPAR